MTGTPGPYEIGERYEVTEVLGWWLGTWTEPPEWTPVMGPLHQDLEHFEVEDHHYHVDPRFIDEHTEEQAFLATERRLLFTDDDWHRAYRIVVAAFPVPENGDRYFVVKSHRTEIHARDEYGKRIDHRTKGWGAARIRLRRRTLECRRELPPASITADDMNIGFHELHNAYRGACGDVCPHKGYDLRSIPVDRDGYRRCPMHQLRVKAPQHSMLDVRG